MRLGPELRELLGPVAFVRLAEAFGGTRLNVPVRIDEEHEIAQAIGIEAARELSRRLAPDVIRVPLAREERAVHYRAVDALSNAQIARKLGVNETTVNKLFRRLPQLPAKGSGQLTLFSD